MKLKVFVVIICAQIVVITFLFFQILHKKNDVLGISVNTIDSRTIQKAPSRGLKYFYEPLANTVQEINRDWLPQIVNYKINNDALNERFNYSIHKKKGVFRIITLGDSFTFGQNVSTEKNWTELLEDYLNNHAVCSKVAKYEIINLGVEGYDTQYELERYRLRGVKYNPDLLIWYVTDLYRLTEKIIPLLKLDKTNEAELEKKSIYYSKWSSAVNKINNEYGMNKLLNFNIKILENMRHHYSGPILYITDYFADSIRLKRAGGKEFLLQPLLSMENKKYFLPDMHLNDEGHKKMMEKITEYLVNNKIIPCTNKY